MRNSLIDGELVLDTDRKTGQVCLAKLPFTNVEGLMGSRSVENVEVSGVRLSGYRRPECYEQNVG